MDSDDQILRRRIGKQIQIGIEDQFSIDATLVDLISGYFHWIGQYSFNWWFGSHCKHYIIARNRKIRRDIQFIAHCVFQSGEIICSGRIGLFDQLLEVFLDIRQQRLSEQLLWVFRKGGKWTIEGKVHSIALLERVGSRGRQLTSRKGMEDQQ